MRVPLKDSFRVLRDPVAGIWVRRAAEGGRLDRGLGARLFGGDVAVDLGTANTRIFVRGEGVSLFEPSVVTVEVATERLLAVGAAARKMLGRAPGNIAVVRPLRRGVIANFELTAQMLSHFISQVRRPLLSSLIGPRVVVCVPSEATRVEIRALREAVEFSGAREVFVVEEPLAAAIGAGLPVSEPRGSMVVDLGAGKTEVAVISLGGIVTRSFIRIGGEDLDRAIATYIQREHKLTVGPVSAERLKMELGSALPPGEERSVEVRGRSLLSGFPQTITVSGGEIREAIGVQVEAIVAAVRDTLDRTPPDLASDIMDVGMVLTGGGALLRRLDERLRRETGVPVHVADDPLECVTLGAGRALEEMDHHHSSLLPGD
ncbi:rod shape-determining protein [Rubrobacter taiwanensis]|jgi:rod shape-determining protein MreB|uniref:Cell shape-determining protein MreB n=1 Tax=Rubrobacter taiwanensis TaxID=185139 RepID=A0A4R1BQM4_9ACTN|nr:rod shape-determining protein [Rubrobacter taiwanensis]TCJ20043.1 rod shape-determining protein [Rubrobacter taiwanensis]